MKWLSHLQADASVAETSRAALAIRIETLLVTSHAQEVRPPRAIALALAAYVWSLADALPPLDLTTRGADVFAATCARCHAPPAFTGPPVPLDVVGTDPAIGRSLVRGTGTYRVPSLRGVGARGALFHDASLPGLEELLDPARVGPTYAGGRHGAGAVSGHTFGLDLPNEDRASLLEFLKTL